MSRQRTSPQRDSLPRVEPVWVLISSKPQRFMPDELHIDGLGSAQDGIALGIGRALTVHRGRQVGSCNRRSSALNYPYGGSDITHTGEYEVWQIDG